MASASTNRESAVMAIDLGGTKVLTALITRQGVILDRERCPTLASEGPQSVIGRMFSFVDLLLERNSMQSSQLAGIGIAAAGAIDSTKGVITLSPNLPGWENISLRDIMQEKYGVEVFLVNDGSAAALGEHQFGAGRGTKNLVLATLGTGIGGGIVIDGELYIGTNGGAGEIGHMTIDVNGPRCTCGSIGCWEELAAGKAVAREAVERIKSGEKSALVDMVKGNLENITAEKVDQAAQAGDPLAKEVMELTAFYLGVGLANLVNIFNPEVIVLGGGMVQMGERLFGPARAVMRERAFTMMTDALRVVPAELGNDAGIYGASVYAFKQKVR